MFYISFYRLIFGSEKKFIQFMKAIIFAFVGIITAAGFCSCNKDFTCRCTFADTTRNFDIKIEKVRKNDAKVLCTDYGQFVGNCVLQ
jgi:hypothetical protein